MPKIIPKNRLKYLLSKTITTESGCMEWQGAINLLNGYGMATVFGKSETIHRHIYRLSKGEIPKGLFVLHKCDNKICINPEHLFLGTNQDNIDDMIQKDRKPKGDNHPQTVLTELKKQKLFQMVEKGNTYYEIGKELGISYQHASKIAIENGFRRIKRKLIP